MRVLFIGDIVGQPGVQLIKRALPQIREREALDLIIANAENASGGSGLTPAAHRILASAGIDGFTMGDHIYKKSAIIPLLSSIDTICKPANFPSAAPGREWFISRRSPDCSLLVISLLGRTFMRPVNCPFEAADRVLATLPADHPPIFVDVHAEATAEKYLLGRYLDGRVSAVLGTHTHVPTADEQILPGGTAFICDVGMTGPYDSILGRRADRILSTNMTFVPTAFDVAEHDVRIAGAIVDIDPATKRSTSISRVMYFQRDFPD